MEKIEISYKTIVFTIFFTLFLLFLYQIRKIILFLFISLIFVSALSPIVDKMEKFKIPRRLAVFLIYLLIILTLVLIIASVMPIVISQTVSLIERLPSFLTRIGFYRLNLKPSDYSQHLVNLPQNIFRIVISTFSGIIGIFAFLVVSFYLLMERKKLSKYLHFLFAEEGEKKTEKFILSLEQKLGGWVRGQIILMFIIGLLSYLGLKLLALDYALPLALLAGFLEFIPNIGPTVAMVPAAVVGFAYSLPMGFAVIALYFSIQQLENNIIVPKVMEKTVGLHPLITLLSLMVGFKIGGFAGSVLSVPLVLFIKVFFETFFPFKKIH